MKKGLYLVLYNNLSLILLTNEKVRQSKAKLLFQVHMASK